MLEYKYAGTFQKVLLLSDLWGHLDALWADSFKNILDPSYLIEFIDMVKLGNIDTSIPDETLLHKQFLKTGISRASRALLNMVNLTDIVIGCSIGGVIAWKAALQGLSLKKMICISSTRLRYEKHSPDVSTKLIFGKDDPYKPDDNWFDSLSVDYKTVAGGHEIYKNNQIIKEYIVPIVLSAK